MSSTTCYTFKRAATIFIFVWSCLAFVEAFSTPKRPLKRYEQPSTLALEILHRKLSLQQRSPFTLSSPPIPSDSPELQYSDTFRLTLTAYGQSYHLHLGPNPHILHPSARINYYKNGPDGQSVLDRTEPMFRGNVKAYWGDVLHPDVSYGRLREDNVGGLINSQTQSLGWARIIVHHQGDIDAGISPVFEGAFSVNGVVHHIMTKENYIRTKLPLDPQLDSPIGDRLSPLIIFRDSDIMSHEEEAELRKASILFSSLHGPSDGDSRSNRGPSICSHDQLEWNTNPRMNPALRKPVLPTWFERIGLGDGLISSGLNISTKEKRDDVAGGTTNSNFADHIGQSIGCPISQQIVYMGVAADCQYVQQYGSQQNATTAILNDWNLASALYKTTFNVSLGIIQVDIHDPTCPTTPDPTHPWNVDCGSVTLNDRLSLFSQWRGQKGSDGTGLWHLMSGCPTGTEVGVAWLGTLCQSDASGTPGNFVSGTAVSTAGRAEWQVVAHEIGHNFGAIHDCTSGCNSTSPCCPLTTGQCDTSSQFLMSPTASIDEAKFSLCTLGNICSMMLGKLNTTCVQHPDPNKQTFSLQMCGNGIVETGEDCDPGKGSNSTCCNAATCKFTSGSVCDPLSSPCCTNKCQFAPSTQVCREAQDPTCDTEETCTGNSSSCPWDRTKPNGLSCGPNGLACASGKCTSPSRQCQTIGSSMNLTTACPNKGDASCQVTCQDPNQSNQCVILQSQLVDGSPCGFGGECFGGRCKPGSLLDTAKSWYLQNLQISIPITVVVGVVVLFVLYGLIRCFARCCGSRQRAMSTEPALNAVAVQRIDSRNGPPVLQVPQQGPVEHVWIPPPAASPRGSRYDAISTSRQGGSSDIPTALRPGAQMTPRRYGDNRYPRPSLPSSRRGGERRTDWVDPYAWNGPPQ